MLAERTSGVRPTSLKLLTAALALGLGLAPSAVSGASAATTADQRVAIIVPIVVPAGTTGLLTAEQLAQYTAVGGLLSTQLDAVSGKPVTVAVDPMIIVSIRLLGTSAPDSAAAWLARLGAIDNESFALAWADADITLAGQADAPRLPTPQAFDFAIDPALFAPAPTDGSTDAPDPAATSDPQVPNLPTSDDLLAWPYSIDGIAWPVADTVTTDDLGVIAASGYRTSILSSGNVSKTPASAVGSLDTGAVIVEDAAVSGALASAASNQLTDSWTTSLAQLESELAAASPGTVVATLDRTAPGDRGRLADTITALAANDSLELVPLSEVLPGVGTSVSLVEQEQSADDLASVKQLFDAERAERRFLSVTPTPESVSAPRRLALLALLSAAWSTQRTGWELAVEEFESDSRDLRGSVHLVATDSLLLVADNGQYLPITVANDLNQPVTVFITVEPDTALLAIDDSRVQLDLEPGAQANANVPVHSLSNGVVDVRVSLESGSNVTIGRPIHTEVNVQAGWETPIVVTITVLVAILFAVGVVRTILKRRRSTDD